MRKILSIFMEVSYKLIQNDPNVQRTYIDIATNSPNESLVFNISVTQMNKNLACHVQLSCTKEIPTERQQRPCYKPMMPATQTRSLSELGSNCDSWKLQCVT